MKKKLANLTFKFVTDDGDKITDIMVLKETSDSSNLEYYKYIDKLKFEFKDVNEIYQIYILSPKYNKWLELEIEPEYIRKTKDIMKSGNAFNFIFKNKIILTTEYKS